MVQSLLISYQENKTKTQWKHSQEVIYIFYYNSPIIVLYFKSVDMICPAKYGSSVEEDIFYVPIPNGKLKKLKGKLLPH